MENSEFVDVQPKKKTSAAVKILTAVAVVLVLVIAGLIGMLTYRFAIENLDLRIPLGTNPSLVSQEAGTP